MFYSHYILAKKGPLGTIWIAAHLERKLRKNQVNETDISTSVDSILFPEVPIALRLSGHLLLGVVRIYSRKVNYLFQDCNDALIKLKNAFASSAKAAAAAVNLPPEAASAPFHAITLPEHTFEFDGIELEGIDPGDALDSLDHHVTTRDQITLEDPLPDNVYPGSQFDQEERFTQAPHSMDLETNQNFRASHDLNPPYLQEDILPPMDMEAGPSTGAYPEVEKVRSVPDFLEEDGLRATPDIVVERDFRDVIQPVDVPIEEPRLVEDEQLMLSTPATGVRQVPEPNSPFFQPAEPTTDETPILAVVETPVEAPHKKGTPRKRKQAIDSEVILPSSYFKEMLNDSSDLRRVRRKVTDVRGSWVSIFEKERLGKRIFSKPSLQGLCSGLEELYDRAFTPPKRQKTEMSTPTVTFAPGDQPSHAQASPAPSKSTSKVSEAPDTPDNSIQSSKPPQVPERAELPDTSLQEREEDVLNLDSFADPITPATDIAEPLETGSRPDRSLPELEVEVVQTADEHTPVIDSSVLLATSDVVATSSQSEGWSERTRAIAEFLRARFEDASSAEVSVGGLLRGKTRKEAARFFFETLVLRTNDYITVKQNASYGDITIYAQPRLMKAVF